MILTNCSTTTNCCSKNRITRIAAIVLAMMKNVLASALCLSAPSVVISPLCHLHCNVFLAAAMCQPCQTVPVRQTELSEGIPYFGCCYSMLPSLSSSRNIFGPVMEMPTFKAKVIRWKSQVFDEKDVFNSLWVENVFLIKDLWSLFLSAFSNCLEVAEWNLMGCWRRKDSMW